MFAPDKVPVAPSMEHKIESLFVGAPFNLRLPAEFVSKDVRDEVRYDLLAEKLMGVDWGWRMKIHEVKVGSDRLDLEELVKEQIWRRRLPIKTFRGSVVDGLRVAVRDGIGMVHYPYHATMEHVDGPDTPADAYCYLPRDCETLVIHSGRACLALVTTSLDPMPDPHNVILLSFPLQRETG